MYSFDPSPYTCENPAFTEEETINTLPPTYDAWKDSISTYSLELSRQHEKVNLKPQQCWWFSWMILRPFFQSKGYRLYDYDPLRDLSFHPTVVDPPAADAFGLYGDRSQVKSRMKPNSTIFGARDSLNRDMVIKFVDKYSPNHPKGSVELQILRALNSPSMRLDPRNATVPVLEFLDFHGWIFVVMPAYDGCDDYCFQTSRECLDFACQVLEALSFLHEQRIAHLDISHENIMMNHRGGIPKKFIIDEATKSFVPVSPLPEFRSTFPIKYSLIDFGNSAYFLPGLPRHKCFVTPLKDGRAHRAPEVDGRFKHDPFAADVYQTAVFFFSYFGRIIYPEVPGLLELLRDMSSVHAPDRISMSAAALQMRSLYDKLPAHDTLPRHAIEVEEYYSVPRSILRHYYEYFKWSVSQAWKSVLKSAGASLD
ncbi:hypothetical protein BDN70DRAFT_830721 [Pholiota conissans]|uniref:Protein kinase domain-containing protein n=1 Tax=Pholiota conissans TaxID=109636 RepID=A0A9P6D2N9_9AGAR|nr:hypothetical protein BDN70DRAFT_830721 [Pholiota conissans]